MKRLKFTVLLAILITLISCGRSKDTTFYVLKPLPPLNKKAVYYPHLQIGIETIHYPAWLDKPQIMIHAYHNQVSLEEYHQWAEPADKNIQQLVSANLSMLLPNAIIKQTPFDVRFQPAWLLQISIDELSIDYQGNSFLRANYLIYHQEKLIKKQSVAYQLTITKPTIEQLVESINAHLNHLTSDMAKTFASLA